MDGGVIGSESLHSSNWEVYKDAFAPPQPGRRVKPWERAPVPAHAPRLQGQKVWKKVNIKPQPQQDDKENHDAAQAELNKAGMGARKRPRMIGGKENIGDAPWKMGILDDEELGSGVPSPKKQRLSMATGDADAFIVPRKRTNANLLITPRKPSRKTPLIDHAQASVSPQIPSETMFTVPLGKLEPTPDASKSHANLSPQKMPPNDWNHNDNRVTASTEKPVWRKSLRQSTRRLTRGTTPEQPPAAPAEEITAGFNNYISESAAPAIERPKKDAESLRAVCDSIEARGLASSADALKNGAIGAFVQEPVALKAVEESSRGSQDEAELSVEGYLAPLNVVEESMNESPRLQQQEVVLAQNSGKANKELANIEVDPAIAIGEKFTSRANQTPKSQPPVLNSIELGAEISFVSPTKSAGTPRLRRKTPQRRGSRRSTRLTRANSVPPEDISAQKIAAHKPSAAEISNPTSAPIKPGVTSTPAMETSKPADHDAVVAVHTLVENANSQHTEATELASKLSIEIEIQDPEVGSTGVEAIATTHSSDLVNQSEHVKILEPVFNDISSGVEVSGEGSNLAISATFGDIPSLADTGSEDHNGAITATFEDKICFEGGNLNTQEEATMEIGAAITLTQTKDEHISSPPKPSLSEEFAQDNLDPSLDKPRASSVEALEVLEPISIRISTKKLLEDSVEETTDDLPETSTPNPSTTELVDTISENAPANGFDHDDTDMLRNFLTRVKANKAAKASTTVPKRKRSLPHSPIRLPLGSEECGLSPSSPKTKDDFDVSLPAETSTKRKHDGPLGDEDATEPKSIRRSGRTRLPVKATTVAAPSFIPVRRLGQDGDSTVTLRKNEEKELATLTRVNTRKNKGVALPPMQVLAKQAEEKEDPASRQRALKEIFDEKAQNQKKTKKRKTVVWAAELAQFQTEEGKIVVLEEEKEKAAPIEEKKNAVKVGVRSKMTLGMVVNGTPAPKRKMRGRS